VHKMPSVSVDEYLEALWVILMEKGQAAKIKLVAKELHIAPPSVVQMFGKMKSLGLVEYDKRGGAELTRMGKKRAKQLVRNHRLMEKLLVDVVGVKIDEIERPACGAEHHLSLEVADAICTFLKHPRKCPHGNPIPKGKCCMGK